MSSSKGDSEKSEKQRIWELEEQLDDEQYAHRKTKSALRSVQEKLEEMSNRMESKDENSELVESLMRENGELKRKLKEKDEKLEEEMDLAVDLNRDIQNLRTENSILENSNQEMEELVEKLKNEKGELMKRNEEVERENQSLKEKVDMMEEFKRGIQDLIIIKNDLMGISGKENGDLKNELKQELEKAVELERRIHDLREEHSNLEKSNQEIVEAMKVLESERDELKMALEKEKGKGKNYEKRLEEYKKEVKRLFNTRNNTLLFFNKWVPKYSEMIGRLISVLNETNSTKNEEEVKELEEDEKKAYHELQWWWDYRIFCWDLYEAFSAIQDIRGGGLISKEDLDSSQSQLNIVKKSFEEKSRTVRRGKEEKKWVKEDLDLKYLDTWRQLLTEASEKINES